MKKECRGTSYFKDLSRKDYGPGQQDHKRRRSGGYQHPAYCGRTGMFFCQYKIGIFRIWMSFCFMPSWTRSTSISWICQNVKRRNDIWDAHFGICVPMPKRHLRSPRPLKLFLPNINRDLGEALKEYYEMFSGRHHTGKPLHQGRCLRYPAITRGTIIYVASGGRRTEDSEEMLNHIICTLFRGYFTVSLSRSTGASACDEIPEPGEPVHSRRE